MASRLTISEDSRSSKAVRFVPLMGISSIRPQTSNTSSTSMTWLKSTQALTQMTLMQAIRQRRLCKSGQISMTSSPTTRQVISRMVLSLRASSSLLRRPPKRSTTSLIRCRRSFVEVATTIMWHIFIAQSQATQDRSHLRRLNGFRSHKPTKICRSTRYSSRSMTRLTRPSACLHQSVAWMRTKAMLPSALTNKSSSNTRSNHSQRRFGHDSRTRWTASQAVLALPLHSTSMCQTWRKKKRLKRKRRKLRQILSAKCSTEAIRSTQSLMRSSSATHASCSKRAQTMTAKSSMTSLMWMKVARWKKHLNLPSWNPLQRIARTTMTRFTRRQTKRL